MQKVTDLTSLPMSLRTQAGELRYQDAKNRKALEPLSQVEPIKEWKYWKLIPNQYPYDMAFRRHNMLVPKRQYADRGQMHFIEWQELQIIIRDYIEKHYDVLFDNMQKRRSNTTIYHVHVANYYRKREEVSL